MSGVARQNVKNSSKQLVSSQRIVSKTHSLRDPFFSLGAEPGAPLGESLGMSLGDELGRGVGLALDGAMVGEPLGEESGLLVGDTIHVSKVTAVGGALGATVGEKVLKGSLGLEVGSSVMSRQTLKSTKLMPPEDSKHTLIMETPEEPAKAASVLLTYPAQAKQKVNES